MLHRPCMPCVHIDTALSEGRIGGVSAKMMHREAILVGRTSFPSAIGATASVPDIWEM